MFGIVIDRSSNLSITRQVCDQIRNFIESGEMKSGIKLPPTRQMAQELQVSRNVMIEVYEQLTAEGYLESNVGSGTYVAEEIQRNIPLPDITTDQMLNMKNYISSLRNVPAINKKSLTGKSENIIDFACGIPDLESFPRNIWAKYLKIASESSPQDIFDYGDTIGDEKLRNVLSEYIFRVKGICCHPDQIMIVSGSSEGFLLIAKAFSGIFSSIHVEDPTVDFVRNIFSHMGYKIQPVDIDQNGMMVNHIKVSQLEQSKTSSLILLTPSHQFPTGSILSIQRRQQAVKIAEEMESFIIEDDYDSEFRLKGVPIPPIQVLSPSRVIYVGTFSKNLSPGLRLGFLILPCQLISNFEKIKNELNIYSSNIQQRAMADFIKDGHLDRHIYNMKSIYKKRRIHLVECLRNNFGDYAVVLGDDAGMHIQVEFAKDKYADPNWEISINCGVKVTSIEDFCMIKGNHKNKIVLGYGNIDLTAIETGIKRLHQFLNV